MTRAVVVDEMDRRSNVILLGKYLLDPPAALGVEGSPHQVVGLLQPGHTRHEPSKHRGHAEKYVVDVDLFVTRLEPTWPFRDLLSHFHIDLSHRHSLNVIGVGPR
jgi:hypothetical protein